MCEAHTIINPLYFYFMIKLSLIKGCYSSLDDSLNLDTLLQKRQETVLLSCNEPRYKMGGDLEQGAANYLSSLLPWGYTAKWDNLEECCCLSRKREKTLPAMINSLRFRVILQQER